MLIGVLIALLRSILKESISAWIFTSGVNFAMLMLFKNQKLAMTGLRKTGMRRRKCILNGFETLLHIYAGFDILVMINGVLHFTLTAMRNMNFPFTRMASSYVTQT